MWAQKVSVEKVILAVGIIGNTENLGLENTSAKVSNGQLVVDKWGATRTGLHAVGDLVGAPWLAHKASHEDVICVERIAGLENVHPSVNQIFLVVLIRVLKLPVLV